MRWFVFLLDGCYSINLGVGRNFMTTIHSQFYVRISGLTIKDSYVEDEMKFYAKKHKTEIKKLSLSDKFKLEDEIIKKLLADYSSTSFDTYKQSDYSTKCEIAKKAIAEKNDKIVEQIKNLFVPETTEFSNVFLIEMKYFQDFIKHFSNTLSIDWTHISKCPYYDWNVDCLRNGNYVLDWYELMKNKTTSKFFKNADYSQELSLIAKDNIYYERGTTPPAVLEEDNPINGKSLFVIMQYGVPTMREYFLFEDAIKKNIKSQCPLITKAKWLSEYVPYDKMNKEKLKFELVEYDFILAGGLDIYGKQGDISFEVYDYAVQKGLNIVESIPELATMFSGHD